MSDSSLSDYASDCENDWLSSHSSDGSWGSIFSEPQTPQNSNSDTNIWILRQQARADVFYMTESTLLFDTALQMYADLHRELTPANQHIAELGSAFYPIQDYHDRSLLLPTLVQYIRRIIHSNLSSIYSQAPTPLYHRLASTAINFAQQVGPILPLLEHCIATWDQAYTADGGQTGATANNMLLDAVSTSGYESCESFLYEQVMYAIGQYEALLGLEAQTRFNDWLQIGP